MRPIEFEVFLIQTMACDQELRDHALDRLGVSVGVADGIRRDVSGMTELSPGQIYRLIDLLGDDARVDTVVDDGEESTLVRCAFGTWPGLQFQVVGNRQGYWVEARFVRVPGESVQPPARPEQLEPWKYTLEEVSGWFGPLDAADSWSSYSEYGLRYMEAGWQADYDVTFSWDLLQQIKPRR